MSSNTLSKCSSEWRTPLRHSSEKSIILRLARNASLLSCSVMWSCKAVFCKFSFLHCVAEYPAPFERLQLDFIDKMNRRYPDITIGYSGHEDPDDNTVPMLAIAKGARILERHVGLPTETITLNAYSMNPDQADKWVVASLQAKTICGMKKSGEKYISQEELDSLNSLMRGVYVKRDIKEVCYVMFSRNPKIVYKLL